MTDILSQAEDTSEIWAATRKIKIDKHIIIALKNL